MNILGISCYYHDSAACLLQNGKILAAAQEERFTRLKHDESFPINSILYCLSEGQISPDQIDFVVFYDKPFLKFDRLLETYLEFAPFGFVNFLSSFPSWIKDKLFQKRNLVIDLSNSISNEIDWKDKLLFSEHHLSHAASAFFPSPFEDAAILTMDGVGEWATTSIAIGNGNKLSIIKEINFPHSLGLLYSAMTYYLGFKVNSGEYKVMGLAPYGRPVYADLIRNHLIDIKDDGSYALDMSYFSYCTGLTMTNSNFHKLFGGEPREPESELTQREMDLAASIQNVVEEVVLKLCRHISKSTGLKNLCLAGGVALNCVANGKLLNENIFDNVWVQPASGDAGGAVGAALAIYYLMQGHPRVIDASALDGMSGSYLGPSFSQSEVEVELRACGAVYETFSEVDLLDKTAMALANGKAVGWMSGRMEFGPRSLGGRSILADPRSETMQKDLNLKVKFRESFRPFAPSILYEDASDYFELNADSPYMLFVAEVAKSKRLIGAHDDRDLFGIDKLNIPRSSIPSVTHIDFSARIQTVHPETNPKYHRLLKRFKEITNCPILVNTSFNVRGEPIVCSPSDAFHCFMGTGLDVLVVENCYMDKRSQNEDLLLDYKSKYALD